MHDNACKREKTKVVREILKQQTVLNQLLTTILILREIITKNKNMPSNTPEIRLSIIIRQLSEDKRGELAHMKERSRIELGRPDFIWHYLLQSFSTMGRSAGLEGLIRTSTNYDRVTFPALKVLPASDRLQVAQEVCRAAKVRMPNRKGHFIVKCFDRVCSMGGPEAAKAELLAKPDREAKILWLKGMPGIGDKYARNIMMDVYHEDFRDSIAIDARINAISHHLGVSFASYAAHEKFYLGVAKIAGVNGWELDRILYNFRSEVEQALAIQTKSTTC